MNAKIRIKEGYSALSFDGIDNEDKTKYKGLDYYIKDEYVKLFQRSYDLNIWVKCYAEEINGNLKTEFVWEIFAGKLYFTTELLNEKFKEQVEEKLIEDLEFDW